jgi:hypothetical protein
MEIDTISRVLATSWRGLWPRGKIMNIHLKHVLQGGAIIVPIFLLGLVLPIYVFEYCREIGYNPQTAFLIGSIPFLTIVIGGASYGIGWALYSMNKEMSR